MNIVWITLGAVLLIVALGDAVSTLVTTRVRKGRWWPTAALYRLSWPLWRQLGVRGDDADRRERILGAYGPASLLALLITWVGLEVIGWGLIWYALRDRFDGIESIVDAWYFSGVAFFTVGFGDIVPDGGVVRILVICSAFTGVVTIALVVGFLPTLYSAYSDREAELLTLDDLSGTYVTPVGLIEVYAPDTDTTMLYERFGHWERWVARVIQTHSAYRMLVMFRSRRTGQSWLAGLGVITDTAVMMLGAVQGAATREPLLLYRRATELMAVLEQQLPVGAGPSEAFKLMEHEFRDRYQRLGELGFPLRPFDEAWEAVRQLRSAYVPQLLMVSWSLLAPVHFRNPEILFPEVLGRLAREDASPDDPPPF